MSTSNTDDEYPAQARELWRNKGEEQLLPHPFKSRDVKMVLSRRARHNERQEIEWDKYDTAYYNRYQQAIVISPTRFLDPVILETLRLTRVMDILMKNVGMGHIAVHPYALYPDLVRQFLSSCYVHIPKSCHDVNNWSLKFKIDGVCYSRTIAQLCEIFGFQRRGPRFDQLLTFPDRQGFWQLIGRGAYEPSSTKQAEIRHPALRILARAFSHTLLRRNEPGRLYAQELTLLYYAVGEVFVLPDAPKDDDWNMGALFARHLVSLRNHAFAGRHNSKKEEKVGSILYPIFRSCRVPLSGHTRLRTKKKTLMDDDSLQHSDILRAGRRYEFTQLDGTISLVQLPNPALTAIDSLEALRFTPPTELLVAAPPPPPRKPRRHRAAPSTAAGDDADDTTDERGFFWMSPLYW